MGPFSKIGQSAINKGSLKRYPITVLLVFLMNCQLIKKESENTIINLRESTDTLSLFAKNHVSTPLYERDIAISPKLDELIYTLGDYKQNKRCLVTIKKKGNKWKKPEILNLSGTYQDLEPFLSNEGNRLYFASNRPIYGDVTRKDYNIWYSDKNNDTWSDPVPLDSVINTKQNEFYPSLSKNGNLYFTSIRENGFGKEDIFISEFIDGQFQFPKPLPSEINTSRFEFNAFIGPDEDYIIFSSFGRDDGFGSGDLYISKRDSDGNWKQARNLGRKINSDKLDYCPFVDSESLNMYFTSERVNINDITLKTINQLKQSANSIENGLGNIYRIDFKEVNRNYK